MTKDLIKQNYPSIRRMFESADLQDQLSKAIPSLMDLDQLIRVSLTVIRTNPKLLECSQPSLMACLFGCGTLGLSPEPFLGQAYFVPFWNGKLKTFEATLIPGYRGMITLWRRSGEGHNLSSEVVFEKDQFNYDLIQWSLGNYHSFTHKPSEEEDPGRMKGAWCILSYKNGTPSFEYMPAAKIEKRKQASKARNDKGEIVGPWIDWPDEMARKTVIKYALKTAPMSIEDHRIVKAAYAEDLALSGQSQKDFFLPQYDEPIEISTSGGDARKKADNEAAFNKWAASVKDEKRLAEFIRVCSVQNRINIEEVREQAAENLEEFKAAYENWKKADDKTGPTTDEAEQFFIDEWNNLPGKSFKKYVEENMDLFRTCTDDTKEKALDKWKRLLPDERWPLARIESKSEGDDKGEGKKVQPAASQGASKGKTENVFPKLMEMKTNHPAIYLRVTQGHSPKTPEEMNSVIEKMKEMIDLEGQDPGGIPED